MKFKVHHTAISVRDIGRSVDFYAKLGFSVVHRYEEEDKSMTIVHMKLNDYFIELFRFKTNSNLPDLKLMPANNIEELGVKHLALKTNNVEKALKHLRSIGLADEDTKITSGRTKVEYFFIKDPDGIWVEILKDERYE